MRKVELGLILPKEHGQQIYEDLKIARFSYLIRWYQIKQGIEKGRKTRWPKKQSKKELSKL